MTEMNEVATRVASPALGEAIKTENGNLNGHTNGSVAKVKRLHVATQEGLHKVLGKYERDISLAPVKVPLSDIYTNVSQFQIRKKPFAEESVRKIITAVKKGNLVKELFNPIILRHNEEENKLYVLAGHSRLEAFRRLSDSTIIDEESGIPLCEHPGVISFIKEYNIDFQWIPAHICEKKDFMEAKRISAISNTLGTPEALVDRAMYYQAERLYKGVDDNDLENEFKILEGKNRLTTRALSYLNPNGYALNAIESFVGNDDAQKDIIKVSKWIGEARRKHPRLSNLHEDELYTWMIENGGYGIGKQNLSDEQKIRKINTESLFIRKVTDHIAKLEKQKKFRGDRKLNILGKKEYVEHSIQFEKMYNAYNCAVKREERSRNKVVNQIAKLEAAKNQGVIIEAIDRKINSLNAQLKDKTDNILQMKFNLELAGKIHFKPDGRNMQRLQTAQELLNASIIKREEFKGKKEEYIEAAKAQTSLIFSLEQASKGEE